MKSDKVEAVSMTKKKKEPIAIVGMGCRFPGEVRGANEFWNTLKTGKNAITDVPPDRWKIDSYYDPNPNKAGKIKSRKGGFIKDIDKFDAEFFGIFPAEANRIDPQQRFLLEVTYETLEDAGITMEAFSGSRTAVFMGVFMNDYWDVQTSSLQKDQISPHVPMGVSLTSIANRLSYVYNLKGPSITLDTACSSSLVGVHLACRSIWSGESELALAGGVNMIIRPESSIMMSKGNFLSPDGHCKAFDSRANGYVRSEGCGVVLLKPLSKAQQDGDQIYATILGSAVNQDGHTEEGFTVPSLSSQVEMLKTAYKDADIDPENAAYVEAHGTGTPVGDPIETNAFGKVIGKNRSKDNPCMIGSVKTNIGHLEAAAGIAGLIKLALILKNKEVPKNLHFIKPNPKIPFDDYKLKVVTDLTDLPENGTPAIGGVNSFGAGGTNAHIVMQAYRNPKLNGKNGHHNKNNDLQLFTLTARSKEALDQTLRRYIGYLNLTKNSLKDICYSTATRRSSHNHKIAVAVKSKKELIKNLEAFLKNETRPGMSYHKTTGSEKPKIGFIFSGQGPQWFAMGQQLIKTNSLFRDTIVKIDTLFSKVADWSLLEEMNKDEATSRVSETRIAQPAIMAIQIALTELWKSWGVMPEGCVGHSIGEVAAAYTAGALTLEQAVEVIYHRSKGQHKATNKGKMLAVGLPYDSIKKEIQGYEKRVSVAAINGPNLLTLSGDTEPLEEIAQVLDKKDIFYRFLRVNVPFHSHHMEPLKDDLIDSLKTLVTTKATIPLYSTVTGKEENGLHLDSQYWYKNVREPVFFTDALQEMINDGFNTFVEVAPHPVLTTGAMELLDKNRIKNSLIVPSLRRKEDEEIISLGSLGTLFANGYAIDWSTLFRSGGTYVKLPKYAWQKESYWFETEINQKNRLGEKIHPHLESYKKSAVNDGIFIWDISLDYNVHTYITDHKVDDSIIFPGTGHLELATAVGKASFKEDFSCIEDVHFESALFLPDEGEMPQVRLEISSDEGSYNICTKENSEDQSDWIKHSRGKINYLGGQQQSKFYEKIDLDEIRQKVNQPVSISDFYFELKEGGLQYGEAFRCIQKLWTGKNEVLAALKLSKNHTYGNEKFNFHPALLDACLHTIFAAKKGNSSEKRGIYLPTFIQRYQVYQKPEDQLWSYIKVSEVSSEYLKGDYYILSKEGHLIAEIQGLVCKYVEGSRGENKNDLYKGMYEYQWDLISENTNDVKASNTKNQNKGCYVLFADDKNEAGKLSEKFNTDNKEIVVIQKNISNDKKSSGQNIMLNPNDQAKIEEALKAIDKRYNGIHKIIFSWPLDSKNHIYLSSEELEAQQSQLAAQTLNTLNALVATEVGSDFSIITQGTAQIKDTDTININQAAVYGIGRVSKNEFPFINLDIIDISNTPSNKEWDNLYQVLIEDIPRKQKISELALRGNEKYTRRLKSVVKEEAESNAAKQLPSLGSNYQTDIVEYGILESLQFRASKRELTKADEVEIKVFAAGLNFKDVMNVMGLLDDEAVAGGVAGKNLGLECSGVVTAIGKNVDNVKIGDEVIAWSSNCFSGYTTTKSSCVTIKPDNLSFEEAASLTVVFLTAYYSLDHLARISEEDTVLIHAASGGVGLAAIQIAQLTGAKIIATAGNEQKRDFLRSQGIKHVFDSRSLSFANEVMKATNGKGVDIVLNSLPGKAITQSIKCLAPFGRFIEIGKTDIYNDAKLALKRFGENLSYYAVDLDRLMLQKPKLGNQLYREVASLFEEKKLSVHLNKTFHISKLSEALKYMSKGIHIGKIAVKMDNSMINVVPAKALRLDSNATYLITGGASGFGLMLAKWLTEKGARHLVLLSRSGPKSDNDRKIIMAMEALGVEVHCMKADITSTTEIQFTLNIIRDTMPPLKGIIHSAAVLDDATIPNTDTSKFLKVFNPKAIGAWNIHQATQKDPIDFFVMLSSISSIFGLPGQSNYSAANNFIDKLAEFRQSIGLNASSINLGVLDDYAGMSKEGGNVLNVLANQGWIPLSLKQVTEKVENVILHQPDHRMAANIDWRSFKDFFSHLDNDSRFTDILSTATSENNRMNGNASLVDKLRSLEVSQGNEILQQNLSEALAKILGTSSEKIDVNVSISKIGLDSLMLNQLRNWIQQKLEVNYPLMKIAKGPSLTELAAQLLVEINKKGTKVSEAADSSGIETEHDIEIVNEWLIRNKNNTQEIEQRVFCIHPVGAGASMFSHFIYNPPKGIDILAFQLPGRENRSNEGHYQDIPLLIEDMANAMKPFLDKPFSIYGHSFGGIIGFELIKYLQKNMDKSPIRLFISATIAPQLTRNWKERDVISQTAIESNSAEKLLSLMNYIDDVEFLKRILPIMKKDMPLIMGYNYAENGKFNFPITAFAGDKDEVVLIEEVDRWRTQTCKEFSLETMEGDHWFLSRNKALILQRLEEVLLQDKVQNSNLVTQNNI